MQQEVDVKKNNDILLLRDIISDNIHEVGDKQTGIDNFMISRRQIKDKPDKCFYVPLVSITVQGYKRSTIGSQEFSYGEGDCLVAGIDLPSTNTVTRASADYPFLAATLFLDRELIAELMLELSLNKNIDDVPLQGMAINKADPDVLNAFLRLAELIKTPEKINILSPMIIREIHYRLLTSPQGNQLRALNTLGSQSNQVATSISWLRSNYKHSIQIDELAQMVNMASSTFYRHFKEITTLSPLQYQKRLRLYEAQRLMLFNSMGATEASFEVGYESQTQFNREYKREFGEPPLRDVERLRRDMLH